MPITDRDLASAELWQDSLDRSRRRRILAEGARKDIARRKTASLAVSAAVVAAPAWPGGVAAAGLTKERTTKLARKLERRDVDRVLLQRGDWTPAVAELQRALGIPDDGIFGPQTEAAVLAFQEREGLDRTGEVNVKTWLKLFPNDMVVYASTGAEVGAPDADGPQWAAIDTSQLPEAAVESAPKTAMAAATAVRRDGAKRANRSRTRSHRAATAPVALRSGGDESPAGTDVSAPPAEADPAPQRTSVPKSVPQPAPSFPGLGGGRGADVIRALIAAANRIDSKQYSYRWGGGHDANFTGPYDCSGAVSAVLHAAGLLDRPMVSGDFTRYGAPGRGAVTIYANSGHVYMSIKGRYFGTSRSNPGGGAGWFDGAPRAGFAVVHVPFERLSSKGRAAKTTRAKATRPRTQMTVTASNPRTAPVPLYGSDQGGTRAPAAKSGTVQSQAQAGTVATAQPAASGQAAAPQESYAQPAGQESFTQEATAAPAAAPEAVTPATPQAAPAPAPAPAAPAAGTAPAPAPVPAAPETVTPAPAPQGTPAPAPAPQATPTPAAPETVTPATPAPAPAPEATAPEATTPAPTPAPQPAPAPEGTSAPEAPAAPEATAPSAPETAGQAAPEAAAEPAPADAAPTDETQAPAATATG